LLLLLERLDRLCRAFEDFDGIIWYQKLDPVGNTYKKGPTKWGLYFFGKTLPLAKRLNLRLCCQLPGQSVAFLSPGLYIRPYLQLALSFALGGG